MEEYSYLRKSILDRICIKKNTRLYYQVLENFHVMFFIAVSDKKYKVILQL